LLRTVNQWETDLRWNRFDDAIAEDIRKIVYAVKSYLYWWEREFSREHDYFHLRGQDNHLRYLPKGRVVVRVHEDDSLFEVLARIAAVQITGCELTLSIPDRVPREIYEKAAESGFYISRTPVYMEGRLELLQYLQEQAVCNNYHKYGNLGERGLI
jgi:RHH-type proline utilization regulon transcriptional repressor/proline dehydrogenase/delta 1-pyrroline-5-carboxylate dehydrogenase